MKTCSQCQQTLSLDAFDLQTTGRQGRRADCRECRKRFTRSIPGLIKAIYANQKAKSVKRGYQAPQYTEAQLLEWVQNQPEFQSLYDDWVASNYSSALKPSVDRLNDYVSYQLDNIRLTTWQQNNSRGRFDVKQGINNKPNRAVDMLDMDGKFIERFHSISEAARRFNGIPSNIIGAITQRTVTRKKADGSTREYSITHAYGHRWRYSLQPNLNKEQTNATVHRL